MKVTIQQGSITDVECDAIIVNLFSGVTHPGGATGAVDRALEGLITKTIPKWVARGELGEILSLQTEEKLPAKEVIVLGLGKSSQFGYNEVREVSVAVADYINNCSEIKKVATIVHGVGIGGLDVEKATAKMVEGFAQGLEQKIDGKGSELVIVEFSANKIGEIKHGVDSVSL